MSHNMKILAVVAIVGVIGYMIYTKSQTPSAAAAAAPTPANNCPVGGKVGTALTTIGNVVSGGKGQGGLLCAAQAQFGGGAATSGGGTSGAPNGCLPCCMG